MDPSAVTRDGPNRSNADTTTAGNAPHRGTNRIGPDVNTPPATASTTTSERAKNTRDDPDGNWCNATATAVSKRVGPANRSAEAGPPALAPGERRRRLCRRAYR